MRFLKQVTLTVSENGERWLFSINTPRIYGAQSYDGVTAWIQIYAARSTTKKLFFLCCKPVAKLIPDKREKKKYATRARVRVKRGGYACTAILADKYLYVHSRVDIARTWDIACTRACLFRWREKKGIHFSREKRGGILRVYFDASGISFFKRDPLFVT